MDSDSSSRSTEVTVAAAGWHAAVDDPADVCRRAVAATLAAVGGRDRTGPVTVLLADDATLRALNRDFRGKDAATNVLSFPAGPRPPGLPEHAPWPLGDLAIALETCLREAAAEGKPSAHHLTHLVVHGTLHLLGHDHEDPAEAEIMEGLERRILAGLGIPDPYAVEFVP